MRTYFFVLAIVAMTAGFLFHKPASRSLASLEGKDSADGYCLAVRGNGELMPAHWGAFAQAIESFGLPSAVAGGSSASISSFLLESVLLHPSVRGENAALRASFLVKSFQGFTYGIASQPEWKALLAFVQAMNSPEGAPGPFPALEKALESGSAAELGKRSAVLLQALKDAQATGVLSGPGLLKLLAAAQSYQATRTSADAARLYKLALEAKKSLEMLGKFDARDSNLLLRDGVVNFRALAHLFGRMADFYSLRGASPALVQAVNAYVEKCSAGTAGQSWRQILAKNPECQPELASLSAHYFSETSGRESRIFEKVGAYLPAMIGTAVARDDSARDLKALKEEYERDFDPRAGDRMALNPDRVYFGYWGHPDDLAAVQNSFSSPSFPGAQLPKSKRFFSLGATDWETALSYSPAEPGLSGFLPIGGDGNLVSLGGWSDLHPVPVLKAMGCKNVVYVTRAGGDTLFGQGVAKRIFRFDDVTWDEIDPGKKETTIRNNLGVRSNQSGPWSMMFNLANPKSSYAGSLAMADAVVCTNWNDFDIKKDFTKMVEQAYASPVYLRKPFTSTSLRAPKLITARDNALRADLGYPPYAGCVTP